MPAHRWRGGRARWAGLTTISVVVVVVVVVNGGVVVVATVGCSIVGAGGLLLLLLLWGIAGLGRRDWRVREGAVEVEEPDW